MSKSVETLVTDIYKLFEGHECDPERLERLGREIASVVGSRLASYAVYREPTLRMSNLGRPDRQLWYEIRAGLGKEDLAPHTKFKFLYGDLIESVLLFLAEEAGHDVSRRQEEVNVGGIVGHIDAVIDEHVVDVKSASTHAFKKFRQGTLHEDDPFGYVDQLAGYSEGLGGLDGGWLAADKQNGHITFLEAPREELAAIDVPGRVEHIKAVVASDEVPERCYEPVEEGKSGNLSLAVGCSYCAFKDHCWADSNGGVGLRTFLYSKGPVHMVHVEREPNVPEITF